MSNYITGTWYVIGRWHRGKWSPVEVCSSDRIARRIKLRSMDIRRVKLLYLD